MCADFVADGYSLDDEDDNDHHRYSQGIYARDSDDNTATMESGSNARPKDQKCEGDGEEHVVCHFISSVILMMVERGRQTVNSLLSSLFKPSFSFTKIARPASTNEAFENYSNT